MLYQCLRRCAIEDYVSIMKQMQYPAQEQSLLLRLQNVIQLRLWRNITPKDMGLYLEYPSIIYMLKNIARQFKYQLWILHTCCLHAQVKPTQNIYITNSEIAKKYGRNSPSRSADWVQEMWLSRLSYSFPISYCCAFLKVVLLFFSTG